MSYNSAEINEFSDIWVFCEQRQGKLQPTVLELISEARKLADDMGTEVCGLLLGGKGVADSMAKELGAYGADKVLVCESDLLDTYTTDAYAKVICDTVMAKKPEILLIAATNIGRDLGPRCAARLHTGLTADCTHLDVDVEKYAAFLKEASTLPQAQLDALNREDRNLKMTRPAFGGHLMATIICPRFRPQMATVRPGVLKKGEYNEAKANAVVVEPVAFELSDADIKTKVLEVVKEAKELVDLTGAEVVVSVGRGISKDVETGIKLAEELAEVLGGAIALQMLFGLPVRAGCVIVAAVSMAMLMTNSYKRAERWIIAFVGVVGLSFLAELALVKVDWPQAAASWITPSMPTGSVAIIVSVLGAVVMSHNLFLHSEVIQSMHFEGQGEQVIEERLRYELFDTLFRWAWAGQSTRPWSSWPQRPSLRTALS